MSPGEARHAQQVALVALLRRRPRDLTIPQLVSDVVATGDAVALWEQSAPGVLVELPGAPDPLVEAAREIDGWRAAGIGFRTIVDADYPALLRGVHDAPPIVFYRGTLVRDDRGVSVVGSRQASERGVRIATSIAHALVDQGLSVVSGMALGIDAAAHRGALEAGGRTVAVIGTGINNVYPAAHRDLQEEISRQGLVLSQFWPDAPPRKQSFPVRNATMSGYGLATVVVEAGERSGARIQAKLAIAHGRPVILTDLVVEKNAWAQELVGRPGVHIAAGLREVTGTVEKVVREHDDLARALHRLVPA